VADDPVSIEDLEAEAHVWLARPEDIVDPQRIDDLFDLLTQDERARHERFRFDVHRKLFLVSHALVRQTLSRYGELNPSDWRFEQREHGRPEIVTRQNEKNLRFNLSHTENLAACLVCLDHDCGVDVERLHRLKNLDGVARKVFTEAERVDLEGREGNDLQGRFTDYWTLKEAYMKARGKGFQLPPDSFTVCIDPVRSGQARLVLDADFDDRAADWQLEFRTLEPWELPEYRLGVAIRSNRTPPLHVVVREVALHSPTRSVSRGVASGLQPDSPLDRKTQS